MARGLFGLCWCDVLTQRPPPIPPDPPTEHPARRCSNGVKLVILDEADHLTNDAQFALRRVIEKYTKNTRCVERLAYLRTGSMDG